MDHAKRSGSNDGSIVQTSKVFNPQESSCMAFVAGHENAYSAAASAWTGNMVKSDMKV